MKVLLYHTAPSLWISTRHTHTEGSVIYCLTKALVFFFFFLFLSGSFSPTQLAATYFQKDFNARACKEQILVFSNVQVVAAGADLLGKPPSGLGVGLWLRVLSARTTDLEIFENLNQKRLWLHKTVCVGSVFERNNYWERQENIYLLL